MNEAHELAREVLTAHWTAFERRTRDAADVYEAALYRVLDDAGTAAEVLDAMARFAITAIVTDAASRGIPYEDALAEMYRTVEQHLTATE